MSSALTWIFVTTAFLNVHVVEGAALRQTSPDLEDVAPFESDVSTDAAALRIGIQPSRFDAQSDCLVVTKPYEWPKWQLGVAITVCLILAAIFRMLLWDWANEVSVSDEATDDKNRDRHKIPWQEFIAIAFWFMLLLANAAFVRLICHYDIPRDCHDRVDSIRGLNSLSLLLKDGFIIAFLCGVIRPDRFRYLFDLRHGIIFFIFFFGTSLVFGSLDLIPELSRFSLTTHSQYDSNLILCLGYGLALAVLALVGFHIIWAFVFTRHDSMKGALLGGITYLLSRSIIWCMYLVKFHESRKSLDLSFHLHHYMVGFLIAILAEFNHPISMLLLAIGTGLFVQGLAAYNADPLIYRLY